MSQDSDGHDSSSFQIGNGGGNMGDDTQFMGVGNSSRIQGFINQHQDATLNKNHWVPDHKARQCFKCSKDFTFFYRKHHCRICGNVFCHNCTTVKAIISEGPDQRKVVVNVRMCSECERMIENYNKSLKQNNNLIFSNERSSNYLSSSNFLGIDKFGQTSNDTKGQVVVMTTEEQQELEQIRRAQQEIDKIEQNFKRDGVNLLIKDLEEEKNDKGSLFLGSISDADSLPLEKRNLLRLRDFSVYHIQNIVVEVMKNFSFDADKWGPKLLDFVKTAVDNVKPSSRLLNDTIDFNHFIKIKIINYTDNSKSAYINGIVMSKNLADKRMMDKILNPKILILKDSLGVVKSDPSMVMTDLSTMIDQEEYQVNIVKQKLTQIQPNIIIVEQDVSYKVLDALREARITVITNMMNHKLKRVARFTKTIISPSYNVVDKSFVLGKCDQFRVEKPYTSNLIKSHEVPAAAGGNIVSKDRNLIYFEGCNPALGCTILISGNIQTEQEELRKVKAALKEMLKLARNVILERAFLVQIGCAIPKSITDEGQINAEGSPFLITRNIQNRKTLVMSKVIMKKGLQTEKAIGQGNIMPQAKAADTSMQVTSQAIQNIIGGGYNEESSIAMNQNQLDQLQQILSPQGQPIPSGAQNQMAKVNENYVKTKIDSMCGCPKKEKFTFYQKKQDETIGNLLKYLCKNSTQPCESCKEANYKHLIQYYHRDGCIEIQLQLQQQTEAKKQSQGQKPKGDIIMKGFCLVCNRFVTSEVTMSNQFYEYSKARFFEQFFYNGEKLVNHNPDTAISCCHRSLRDIQRIFMIPGGFQISFTFIPLDVYSIEMIQPKTQDTTETFRQEVDATKVSIERGIYAANEDLKTKISIVLDYIREQKRSSLTKEQKKLFQNQLMLFIQPLKSIKQRLRDLEKEISRLVQVITLPLHELVSIYSVLFLERKILLTFLTYDKLIEEISKVACLLLVMLQMRVIILKQQQIQPIENQHENSGFLVPIQENMADPTNLNRLHSDNTPTDRNTLHGQQTDRGTMQLAMKKISSQLVTAQSFRNEYDLLFAELFSNQQDIAAQLSQNMTQIVSSKQIGTQQAQQPYLDGIKVILKEKVILKLTELANELGNEKRMHRGLDSGRVREGSQNQRQPNASTNLAENSDHWKEILQNGFVTMPLGTDNVYVPLKENDIGSVISFVLASNIYKEAMIRQNYMDSNQKIKGLGKHPRQPGQITQPANTGQEVNPTPLAAHESSMNIGFTQQAQYQAQTTAVINQLDDTIKLLGKNDVFNTELSAHQIETELLCGERLYFLVKFSTDKEDLSVRMVRNNQVAKLKETSLNFTTGYLLNSNSMNQQHKQSDRPFWNIQNKKNEKAKVELNDFQEKVCHELSKDYLDNGFYKDSVNELDKVISMLNFYYFKQNQITINQALAQNTTGVNNTILSPPRTVINVGSQQISSEENSNFDIVMETHSNFNGIEMQHPFTTQNIRESMNANILAGLKSPPLGSMTNTQNTPQMAQAMPTLNVEQWRNAENSEFCGIKSPMHTLQGNPNVSLRQHLGTPKVDFELKIYYPKKFEALRRFYCGSQYDFIQSLLKTKEWTTVSGGKTKSKFYRSIDDKYVYKEIKKGEFKMFLEFAPQYFDYLCKSFFHNYPCALCKILGAFKIKITTQKNGQQKIMKKYLYITENLNFGIKHEDESHIIRYDLKGSSLNRFVKNKENKDSGRAVLHDNNFLLEFMGRPLPIRYTINRILHICINNDTLCLSKSNIVDYSLLTIIDTKKKQVRFGIIDYVQQYTLDKIFESKFKNIINGGEAPTIVDPEKYKQRFKKAMKRYFVGMCIQEEKSSQPFKGEIQEQAQYEESEDEEEERVNETMMANREEANNVTMSKPDAGEIENE